MGMVQHMEYSTVARMKLEETISSLPFQNTPTREELPQ